MKFQNLESKFHGRSNLSFESEDKSNADLSLTIKSKTIFKYSKLSTITFTICNTELKVKRKSFENGETVLIQQQWRG
jgi:hypothetical protein